MRRTIQTCTVFATAFMACISLTACTVMEGAGLEEGIEEEFDSSVQFLRLADSDGNQYELPYRADITPSQAAGVLSLVAHDEQDNEIELTPVVGKSKAEDSVEVPEIGEFEVWPLRVASDGLDPENRHKVFINGVRGATLCWSGQTLSSPGSARWYSVNDAFATDGFIDSSNTGVDFDLYQYVNGSQICSSTAGANRVDFCASYNRYASNRDWQYRVRRYNSYPGSYRFCTNYWWSY